MAWVLGLDIGRTMGFALAGPRYLVGWQPRTCLEGPRASHAGLTHGQWALGTGDHDSLFSGLWERLDELHSITELDVIFLEASGGRYQSDAAVWIQIGLAAIIRGWARRNGATAEIVNNGAAKKHATGTGRADKARMIEAANRLGWDPIGEHAADALFVLDYGLSGWHRRS